MKEKSVGQMKIKFVNGEEQLFEYVRADPADPTVGKLMHEMMQTRLLILNLEESTLFVPFDNIQSVEVSPQPSKIPSIAVKEARKLR